MKAYVVKAQGGTKYRSWIGTKVIVADSEKELEKILTKWKKEHINKQAESAPNKNDKERLERRKENIREKLETLTWKIEQEKELKKGVVWEGRMYLKMDSPF